jgi:hypothetical protein
MTDLKSIHVIGQTDLRMNTRKRGRKRREGGGDENNTVNHSGTQINIMKAAEQANIASTASPVNASKWLHIPQQPPGPLPRPSHIIDTTHQQQNQPQQQQQQQQTGGKHDDIRNIKVELKRNTTQKRVHLAPKKAPTIPKKSLKQHNKANKTRKVVLGLSSLKKRVTRANKLKEKMTQLPINKLKEQLIKKGLIKVNSKAPEHVLRQIATDAQIVASKSL